MITLNQLFLTLFLCSFNACRGNEIPKFVPQGYHLDLFPNANVGVLKGQVGINIATFAEPTNVIELDADPAIIIRYRSIKIVELAKDGSSRTNQTKFEVTAIERILFDPGTLRIHVRQKLQRDVPYKVYLDFETSLKNDSNRPFYMRTFVDNDTHMERKIIVMDLTKSGCYRAFPCFNKPDFKSWISLTVIRRRNFYALSTASVNYSIEISTDPGLMKDYFFNTPPMSMNSLALIISDYRMINKVDPLGVFQSGRSVDDIFDSDTVKLTLKHLEDLLGMPYPLPSFDVVMVPKEANIPYINAFGLIIFNATSSYINYQQLMDLVLGACYQWFFHVATPVYANSTIYSIIMNLKNVVGEDITKNLRFNMSKEFSNGQLLFINLEQTSTEKLLGPHGTNEILRTVSLSMLDRVFSGLLKEAMHVLLRKKQFKMYTEMDIWNAINEVSQKRRDFLNDPRLETLEQVVDSWSTAEPIPLLTVKRDYNSNRVNITQAPFIYSSYKYNLRQMRRNMTSYQPHWIPVVVTQPSDFQTNRELLGWLADESQEFEINSSRNDYIVVNPSQLGPFVVNYDERNWRMLIENFNSLPMSIKLQLLVDSMVLADVGLLDYAVFLKISTFLVADEQHLALWLEYYKLAFKMYGRLQGGLAEKYKTFFILQTDAFFSKISKEKVESLSPHAQRLLAEMKYRIDCLENQSACFTFYEYQTLIYEAKMGKRLTGAHNCEIVRNVSLFDWQIIANGVFHVLYSFNFSSNEKSRVLAMLSCTEQPLAFETYMNLVLLNFNKSGIPITNNDQKRIIENLNYRQRPLLLHFLNKNFHMLKERLHRDVWIALIHTIIKATRSAEDLDELLEFCNKFANQFDSAEEMVTEGLIAVSTEVNWNSEIFPSIDEVLDHAIKNYAMNYNS